MNRHSVMDENVDKLINMEDAIRFARDVRGDGGTVKRISKGRWEYRDPSVLPTLDKIFGEVGLIIKIDVLNRQPTWP